MKVAVVIPVHNRPLMSLAAVRSVLRQTYKDFELIVVDDGSTLEMDAVRREVESGGGTFVTQPHAGVAAARNLGVRHSRGEWVAFLDSDDRWLPDKLEVQCAFHQEHPECRISQTEELWYRNGVRVNPRERHAKPNGDAFARSLDLCCISPSSVMVDCALLLENGGFDEAMRVCEDYDLWIRIALTHQVGYIELPLVEKFGGHSDQLSRSEPAMDRFRVYSLIKLAQSAELAPEADQAVRETIRKKTKVLLKGSRRRRNDSFSELLEAILKLAKQPSYGATKARWLAFASRERLIESMAGQAVFDGVSLEPRSVNE
ncbi:MAG: glycosyltransferase family 2 protein [Bdellovibrionales bacterium]|nr:glycosyltransferase family 2 protein [Bdellovibrionales bacterium]